MIKYGFPKERIFNLSKRIIQQIEGKLDLDMSFTL